MQLLYPLLSLFFCLYFQQVTGMATHVQFSLSSDSQGTTAQSDMIMPPPREGQKPHHSYRFSLKKTQEKIEAAQAPQQLIELLKEQILWAYYLNERTTWDTAQADHNYDDVDLEQKYKTNIPEIYINLYEWARDYRTTFRILRTTTSEYLEAIGNFIIAFTVNSEPHMSDWQMQIEQLYEKLQLIRQTATEDADEMQECLTELTRAECPSYLHKVGKDLCRAMNALEPHFTNYIAHIEPLHTAFIHRDVFGDVNNLQGVYYETAEAIVLAAKEIPHIRNQAIDTNYTVWMAKLCTAFALLQRLERTVPIPDEQQPGLITEARDTIFKEKLYPCASIALSVVGQFLQEIGFYKDPLKETANKLSRLQQTKAILALHAYIFTTHFETKIFSYTLTPDRATFLQNWLSLLPGIHAPDGAYTLITMQTGEPQTAPLGASEINPFFERFVPQSLGDVASDTESPTSGESESGTREKTRTLREQRSSSIS